MDGVLVIDKPAGLTSHDVVAVVRRSLRERRVGHTGTLDPLATGVLPLAIGRATRLVRFLIASDKEYLAGIRFGLSTKTYDISGEETSRSNQLPTREAVEAALKPLRGEYDQLPPAFSAKKVEGERAYARARRDEPVRLVPVPVRVARADLLDFRDGLAQVAITCSAGFYVRSFAHELGQAVGTGACLETLRRTRSGEFTLAQAITLQQVSLGLDEAAHGWIALDRLLSSFPSVQLSEEERRRVAHGQDVACDRPGAGGAGSWVRLLDDQGHLLALARVSQTANALHPAVVLT